MNLNERLVKYLSLKFSELKLLHSFWLVISKENLKKTVESKSLS